MAISSERRILVTGGADFIGTHIVLQLLKQGFKVCIIDNLDNAVEEAVNRMISLVGRELSDNVEFHLGDIRNLENLEDLEKCFRRRSTYY